MYTYLYVILLIIILIAIETGSQYNLKLYNENKINYNLIFGIIGYILIALILSYSFGFEKMGIVNHAWNIGTSVTIILVGYMYFNEKLSTAQMVGVIFGLLGLVLMGLDGYLTNK